jgi:hypothetical protein
MIRTETNKITEPVQIRIVKKEEQEEGYATKPYDNNGNDGDDFLNESFMKN